MWLGGGGQHLFILEGWMEIFFLFIAVYRELLQRYSGFERGPYFLARSKLVKKLAFARN